MRSGDDWHMEQKTKHFGQSPQKVQKVRKKPGFSPQRAEKKRGTNVNGGRKTRNLGEKIMRGRVGP